MTQIATPATPMTDAAPVIPAAAVQIVRGQPDEIELAALVAGLAAHSEHEDEADAPDGAWLDRSRTLRGAPRTVGADARRWSLRH